MLEMKKLPSLILNSDRKSHKASSTLNILADYFCYIFTTTVDYSQLRFNFYISACAFHIWQFIFVSSFHSLPVCFIFTIIILILFVIVHFAIVILSMLHPNPSSVSTFTSTSTAVNTPLKGHDFSSSPNILAEHPHFPTSDPLQIGVDGGHRFTSQASKSL